MIRAKWTDIPLAWVDYMEARVEALVEENRRLRRTIEFLKGLDHDLADGVIIRNEYPMPSVLVSSLPVQVAGLPGTESAGYEIGRAHQQQ